MMTYIIKIQEINGHVVAMMEGSESKPTKSEMKLAGVLDCAIQAASEFALKRNEDTLIEGEITRESIKEFVKKKLNLR